MDKSFSCIWEWFEKWGELTDKEQELFFQLSLALPPLPWEKIGFAQLPNGDRIGIIYAEPKFCLNLAFNILLGIPGTFVPGRVGKEFVAFGKALLAGDTGKVFDCYLKAKQKIKK